MAQSDFTKEMIDLVTKIKKHLRDRYQISIALADPELLEKLLKLKDMDDPVLQGMLSYLMALAGPQWSARFNAAKPAPTSPGPGMEKKRMFGRYRGKSVSDREDDTPRKSAGEKQAENLYRGQRPGEGEKTEETKKERKPVRYYRGQPIND